MVKRYTTGTVRFFSTAVWMATFVAASFGASAQTSLTNTKTVAASNRYDHPGIFERLLLGKNYRHAWSEPVQMRQFDLSGGGYTIVELGGGQQTKSLRLKDKKGIEWVLRTVDKDVEPALPKNLRGTVAQDVVQGLISAAYPYAPLSVAELAKALSVAAPDPVLYYVPDDPAFGEYQQIFAHRICFLERRDPTTDFTDSKSTATVQENLMEKSRWQVMQRQVLQARLLDMLIADWDRHADQWRWGIKDSAGQKFYYAIPRDRDQAFFRATGLIPRIGKAVAMRHLNWFKKRMVGLHKLNYKSREFDPLFLNELDKEDWEKGIQQFQQILSDEVIDKAVAKMPPEVTKDDAAFLAGRLKSRRSSMRKPVMQYYKTLAAEVQVWGTAEKDIFEVTQSDSGVVVQAFAMENGSKGKERYRREFTSDTRKIYLMGLGEKDVFNIGVLSRRSPRIYLLGGEGSDVINMPEGKSKRIHIKDDGSGG